MASSTLTPKSGDRTIIKVIMSDEKKFVVKVFDALTGELIKEYAPERLEVAGGMMLDLAEQCMLDNGLSPCDQLPLTFDLFERHPLH